MLTPGVNEKGLFCFVIVLCLNISFICLSVCLSLFLPLPTMEATFGTTVASQGDCSSHLQVPISCRDRTIQSCKPELPPQKREGSGAVIADGEILLEHLRASTVALAGCRLPSLWGCPPSLTREDLTVCSGCQPCFWILSHLSHTFA